MNFERKKPSWIEFRAFLRLSLLITTDMFNSDDPWAVAITFIPFLASDLNSVAEMPGVFFILSPTIAMIDRFFSIISLSSLLCSISILNSSEIALCAARKSPGFIAKVIEYSEEAWVISIILIPLLASAPKSLDDVPVTPTIAGPCRVIRSI